MGDGERKEGICANTLRSNFLVFSVESRPFMISVLAGFLQQEQQSVSAGDKRVSVGFG